MMESGEVIKCDRVASGALTSWGWTVAPSCTGGSTARTKRRPPFVATAIGRRERFAINTANIAMPPADQADNLSRVAR